MHCASVCSAYLATYFVNVYRFGGAGGGGDGGGSIGGDRGISWDDPLLTDSSIFVLKRRNGRTYGRTDLRTDGQTLL